MHLTPREPTKNKIVKAEILFSRKCNLKCSYCNMPNGKENTLSIKDWCEGMDELKKLGCQFINFYGAEPLLEFNKLQSVLPYAEHIGIDTTLITNGTVPNTEKMLAQLHSYGLRSLTMSYDMVKQDKSSYVKTKKCLDTLLWFKDLGNIRDVAAIATVTKQNYKLLPKMIERMSDLGIWTFFDLYHWSPKSMRYLSKCQPYNSSFALDDYKSLILVLDEVKRLRNEGYLVHNSDSFTSIVIEDQLKYAWKCSDYKEFPSWLTIDCDGSVMPCDDFQMKNEKFSITNISETFGEFTEMMKTTVEINCHGCLWNTHCSAHAIKRGEEDISSYIHGDRTK